MQTINNVELADEEVFPSAQVLASILGESYPAYLSLLTLYQQHGLLPTWRYYHDGGAWLCKVQHKGRTIAWMSAWKGFMQATIYIPNKRLAEVLALDIAQSTRDKILATKDVGKSKPCIVEIVDSDAVNEFAILMRYKMQAR